MQVKENVSILNKILNKIKNSSLYYMINSSDAEVIEPEEIDSTEKVSRLANSSNISEAEMWNIEKAFNESDSALDNIEKEVSKIPDLKKESNNPFSIDDPENEETQTSDRSSKIDQSKKITSSKLVNKQFINNSIPTQSKRVNIDRDRSDD